MAEAKKEESKKTKKPVYKKWWFWVLIAISPFVAIFTLCFIIALFTPSTWETDTLQQDVDKLNEMYKERNNLEEEYNKAQEELKEAKKNSEDAQKSLDDVVNHLYDNVEYNKVSAEVMLNDLSHNTAFAKTLYNNKYVEINGIVTYIDEDLKYFNVGGSEWDIIAIECSLSNPALDKNKALELKVGQQIVVKGLIQDVSAWGFKLGTHNF